MQTAATNRRRMDLAEWAKLPEDEPGEIVDGWLVEEEVPDWIHEQIVLWLGEALRPWLRARGGWAAASGVRLVVSATHGRKPDLIVFLREKPPARGLIDKVPDIVVEIISATPSDQRRDRVAKLAEYAARGIAQYWIIDPQVRSFEILVLGSNGRYEHAVAATEGSLDAIPGCPGLTLDVSGLWAELDELEPGPEAPE
jgi:Uma2 family endonuclease